MIMWHSLSIIEVCEDECVIDYSYLDPDVPVLARTYFNVNTINVTHTSYIEYTSKFSTLKMVYENLLQYWCNEDFCNQNQRG